jgi:hypothetical protein
MTDPTASPRKPTLPDWPKSPAGHRGATMPVAIVASRAEAELIAGMLRSYDLLAVVSADDAGGLEPQLQAHGVAVLVPRTDAATARRLLHAANGQGADGVEPEPQVLAGGQQQASPAQGR